MKVRSVDAIKDANALIERALNEATLYGEKGSKAGNITLGKTENPIIKIGRASCRERVCQYV